MVIANNRRVGLLHHVGLGVGVDREDVLGRHRADPVLKRSTACGNVDVWCDPGPGLTNLVGVVAPSIVADHPATPVEAAGFTGQFFQRNTCVGRTNPTTIAEDDGRSAQDGTSWGRA